MSALFVMVGASIVIALGFLLAFIWSVKSGQYEDDYTPSVRMLFENTPANLKTKSETTFCENYKTNFKNQSTNKQTK